MIAAFLDWISHKRGDWAAERAASKGWFFDADMLAWRRRKDQWMVWEDVNHWILEHPDHQKTAHPTLEAAMLAAPA